MLRYVDKVMSRIRQMQPAPEEAAVELLDGCKISLRPNSDRHERQIYFDRTYEPATLALFDAVLRSGDVVLDIGANLGLMTLHAAGIVGSGGRVISLEPHPAYFPRLVCHIDMNRFGNVTPLQIAAGEIKQARPIYDVPSVNIGRSSLILPKSDSRPAGTVKVERLDDILAGYQVGPVRLMKIDVEGFEPSVLRGAPNVLRQQPVICMEVSVSVDKEEENHLAAHDIIMATGFYTAYVFKHGKGRAAPLMKVNDCAKLSQQINDNVIYVPLASRASLPDSLFFD